MASPFQQQALRRKLIYILLIVVLFTASGMFRLFAVEKKATDLHLREQDQGRVELGSSALQLSLSGSRGFVVCALWTWALDAQKKNRWNELELYVDSLTWLQPHFISPWLFQSWNLAYNVSVEADQVKDKYFYVSRGVQLLGRGEEKNTHHPDLRFNMGFYQQHKIMQSDETNVFRCLYQMSCMEPGERDPNNFWQKDQDGGFVLDAAGRKVIDEAAFAQFCKAHPQFVRRLHDKLRCGKPEDVVRFLEDNKRLPTIWEEDPARHGKKDNINERFPALPPPATDPVRLDLAYGVDIYDRKAKDYTSALEDDFDAFQAARAWYGYAQEAIPQPSPDWPGESAEITDPIRQRKPTMTTNIFRNHPPRAQSYVGERLQAEGWFGPEGWRVAGWFKNDRFPGGGEAVVGTGKEWSRDAWQEAHDMWERRGQASKMLPLGPQEEFELRAKALPFLESRGRSVGDSPGAEPSPQDPDHEGWRAANYLWLLGYARSLTNFLHFYNRSDVEMRPEMIEARRTIFNAIQSVRQGQRDRAQDLYESKTGLEQMRQVLEKYPAIRDDSLMQDELYEFELRYIKLMQDKEGGTYKQLMAAGSLLGAWVPAGAAPSWPGLVHLALTEPSLTSNLPVPDFEPAERRRLEAPGKDGKPFIPEEVVQSVRERHGLAKPRPAGPPPNAPPGARPGTPGMRPPQ